MEEVVIPKQNATEIAMRSKAELEVILNALHIFHIILLLFLVQRELDIY